MKTQKLVLAILILTTFFSCNNLKSSKKTYVLSKSDSIYVDTTAVGGENVEIVHGANNETQDDTIVDIKFSELRISINSLMLYETDINLNEIQKDTVYLNPELGETIEGQTISISTDQLSNVKIEQRYETSLTIMGEGPHCDLIDWKHHDSEWKVLKSNAAGQFICDRYTDKEWEKFPKIQISELKAMVKKHCEEGFYNLITNIKSPTEYPSGVSISRFFLRLTGQRKDNGQTVTKYIILLNAMGC